MTSALTILLAASVASAAGMPPRPAIKPPTKWTAPVPKEMRLRSGMRVVTLERHEVPLVHVRVVVRAGATLDPPDKSGLAAAVAGMLQDGGAGDRTAPQMAAALEGLGDELVIGTDRDGVAITLTVMTGQLERALALISDMLTRPRFDATEWTRARARRLAELARRRDEPRHVADELFDRLVFGDGHPYARPLFGTPATVARIEVEDLRRFYRDSYGPKSTSVLLVGDVTTERAASLVGKAFDHFAGGPSKLAAAPPASKVPAARLVLVDRPGAPQSEMRIGHLGPARALSATDFAPMWVLDLVLGGSFTSRLVQNLREKKGYTYNIRSRFFLYESPGKMVVQTAVRTDATAPALVEILKELQTIREPMLPGEARKGRALAMDSLVEDFSDGVGALPVLADMVLHDLPLDTWARLPSALEPLTPQSIVPMAARLYHPDALTIVIVGDRKIIEAPLRALPAGKTLEIRDSDGNLAK